MADQCNEKASDSKLPAVTDLGKWPVAEERIRQRALNQGMSAEELELLLGEIRRARLEEQKFDGLLPYLEH